MTAALADLRAQTGRITVLAIGAHPDDIELGCGGTLARHIAAGHRVVCLILTDGDGRDREAIQAAARLGAIPERGQLASTRLTQDGATTQAIQAAIRRHAPQIVYTHSAHDHHADHVSVHCATVAVARQVPTVYCYQTPASSLDFHPALFSDIGAFLPVKLHVLEAYRSDREARPYLGEAQVRAVAAYWGRFAGYREVEPLEVLREVH